MQIAMKSHVERTARSAALSICAVALIGCDQISEIGRSPEDRINAAVALSPDLVKARDSVLSKSPDSPERARLLDELKARLQVRAVSCSKGFRPGWLDSGKSIADRLNDRECFAAADAEIARWLNVSRLRHAIEQPPLRPIPKQAPKYIVHSDRITSAAFASDAGVAILHGEQSISIVELENSTVLFKEARNQNSSPIYSLSPNGRVLATVLPNRLELRLAETGELLFSVEGNRVFRWLANHLALLTPISGEAPRVLDLRNGQQVDIPGVRDYIHLAVRSDSSGDEFLLLGSRATYRIAVTGDSRSTSARLIDDSPASGINGAAHAGDLDPAEGVYVEGVNKLRVASIKTGRTVEVSLTPLHFTAALPTGRPGQYLVKLLNPFDPKAPTTKHYVYSLGAETLTPVDTARLGSEKFNFVAPLRMVGLIRDSRISLLQDLVEGEPVLAKDLVSAAQEEANKRKLADFERGIRPADAVPFARSAGLRVYPGPVAEAAKYSRVEAIGVYESEFSSGGPGRPRVEGVVEVRIKRSDVPLVLVLSSYEPVRWMLVSETGARLAAVLVGGNHPSTVVGAGSARVFQIGQSYAYRRGGREYDALQADVFQWTGKPIEVFQGTYRGRTFVVGGAG